MTRRAVMTKKKLASAQRQFEAGGISKKQLAIQFGVSPATMTRWLQGPEERKRNQDLAAKIVAAEREIESLSPVDQVAVRSLAEQMKFTSRQMMSAAENGSAVAARISKLAHRFVGQLDEIDDPKAFMHLLSEIMAMLKTSNEAAKIPQAMLQVNREMAARDAELESAQAIDELTREQLLRIANGG